MASIAPQDLPASTPAGRTDSALLMEAVRQPQLPDPQSSAAQPIKAFVVGLDQQPRTLTDLEIGRDLQDPLAGTMLKQVPVDERPQSLDATVNHIEEASTPTNVFQFMSFLAGEGGQIRYSESTKSLDRALRFVWVRFPLRSMGNRDQADILVVGSARGFADTEVFLQCASWDPVNKWFNFYQRLKREGMTRGEWFWAGHSQMAFDPATRLQGPFDGHVNGNLIMKELTSPWNNWHSSAATIDASILAPDDPLRTYRLFVGKDFANKLQTLVVQPGMDRFTTARIDSLIQGGKVTGVKLLMNQILATATVNFVSSSTQSRQRFSQNPYDLPAGFLLNFGSLSASGIDSDNITIPKVSYQKYQASLDKYGFKLQSGQFEQKGDTFFAFFLPATAREDVVLLQQLIARGIVTKRLAACLMMVDFPNPVYSDHRRRLAAYAPDEIHFTPATGTNPATSNLEALMVSAIKGASGSTPDGSAEKAFLSNWAVPEAEYQVTFQRRIQDYITAVSARLADDAPEGPFFEYTELADSRRREFAQTKLSEFDMTLPVTNIAEDAPLLEMQPDGSVGPKPPGALTGRFVFVPTLSSTRSHAVAPQGSASAPLRQPVGGPGCQKQTAQKAHWSCK